MTVTEIKTFDTPSPELLPYNLGKCLGVYQQTTRYESKRLWWLLVPGLQVIWIFDFVFNFILLGKGERMNIFSGGFVREKLRRNGKVKKREVIDFKDVTDLTLKESVQYISGRFSTHKFTNYTLCADYFDAAKMRPRKYYIFASENNDDPNPDNKFQATYLPIIITARGILLQERLEARG